MGLRGETQRGGGAAAPLPTHSTGTRPPSRARSTQLGLSPPQCRRGPPRGSAQRPRARPCALQGPNPVPAGTSPAPAPAWRQSPVPPPLWAAGPQRRPCPRRWAAAGAGAVAAGVCPARWAETCTPSLPPPPFRASPPPARARAAPATPVPPRTSGRCRPTHCADGDCPGRGVAGCVLPSRSPAARLRLRLVGAAGPTKTLAPLPARPTRRFHA